MLLSFGLGPLRGDCEIGISAGIWEPGSLGFFGSIPALTVCVVWASLMLRAWVAHRLCLHVLSVCRADGWGQSKGLRP